METSNAATLTNASGAITNFMFIGNSLRTPAICYTDGMSNCFEFTATVLRGISERLEYGR